jgi:hypothetical protein
MGESLMKSKKSQTISEKHGALATISFVIHVSFVMADGIFLSGLISV